jgi:uncharacterized protein
MESSRTPGQTEVLAMKLEQSFEVKAPIDQVWDVLIDLERVAPCLPGAAITDRDDEGTYHGTFQVKLGPTTAAYRGQIKIEDVDEASHTATLKAHGSDKRGQGGANATIVNKLFETDDGTRVEAVTDFTITGRLARFGRGGMIEDISNRLMREFAQCLQAGLTGDGAGATAETAAPEPVAAAADPSPAAEPAADPTPAAAPGEGAVSRAEAAPPGMTPDEAAASAAAETRPEDSAAEGKSPAEVGLQPTAAEPGPGPADFESPPGPGQPASVAPPAAAPGDRPAPKPFTPPPAAKPISGIRLFFSVLWERILRLFGRKPK